MADTASRTFSGAGTWNANWSSSAMNIYVTIPSGYYIQEAGAACRDHYSATRAYLREGSGATQMVCVTPTRYNSASSPQGTYSSSYFYSIQSDSSADRHHGTGGIYSSTPGGAYIQPAARTDLYSGWFHTNFSSSTWIADGQYVAAPSAQKQFHFKIRAYNGNVADLSQNGGHAKFQFKVAAISKLAAVSSVTLAAQSTANTWKVTWTSGAHAAGNAFVRYYVIINDGKNETTIVASGQATSKSTLTINLTAPAGTYYAGVRVEGTAGTSYFSNWTWSAAATGSWNVAPGNPSFVYPAAASLSNYNSKPWFRGKTGTDSNGDKMTLQYKMDSGSWTNCGTNLGNNANGTLVHYGTALSAGSHTLYLRAYDGQAYSGEVSRAFTIVAPNQAAISAGALVDDAPWNNLNTMATTQYKWYNNKNGTSYAVSAGNEVDDATYTNLKSKISGLPSNQTSASTVSAGTKIEAVQFNNLRTAIINS